MRGHTIALSPSRRVQNDFLFVANRTPIVPMDRCMALAALVEARRACRHRPPWTALFLKGYALLAQEFPELRRVHISLPWPHLYEYPSTVAMVAFERKSGGEAEVFAGSIKNPASRSLPELVEILRRFNEAPLAEIKEVRRVRMLGRLPWPLRRSLMWLGLNIGRQRANFFGTFALSVYSALGAESLRPLAPCPVVLNYGVIAPDGSVIVRFIYDHRVMDGATVARALQTFETILTETIAGELAAWQ
jgi:hypothetical protein